MNASNQGARATCHREYLVGFYLVDCEDRARAIELVAQIPDTAVAGLGVEVRQVMFADGPLEA